MAKLICFEKGKEFLFYFLLVQNNFCVFILNYKSDFLFNKCYYSREILLIYFCYTPRFRGGLDKGSVSTPFGKGDRQQLEVPRNRVQFDTVNRKGTDHKGQSPH